ncbi:MAG TPA: ATP-binding protein, partial [Bacteroidales bacterium]|nr:ATP-binding protein [Bacteroidales bacterium]
MRSDVTAAARYVKDLIKQGENQQLDFKFEISNARKMAKTFSAFANTEGGKLLIGVKDNGKISGIRSEEEAYMAESAAHVFCKPAVDYNLKKWIVEGKSILEVEIPTSRKRPHYAKDEKG